MRRSKFTDKQVIEIIRESEANDSDISKLCKKHNISEPTLYRWKKKFAGADPASIAELKVLRAENIRMRKLIVDRDLELDVARELLKKTSKHRRPAARLCLRKGTGRNVSPV